MSVDLLHPPRPDAGPFAYEPIVDLATGVPVAHEVLTRLPGAVRASDAAWTERDYPARRILEHVAHQVGRHRPLHVNVSAEELADGSLPELLGELVPPNALPHLTLEVTEHAPLPDTLLVRGGVGRLRAAGVRFAVDDFGEGWANLSSLRILQPEVIKVTRSLLVEADLTRWLVGLAASLGAVLVLEQIETPEHLAAARAAGIDLGQGHLWHATGCPD